jgi:Autophagy protein ATG9
MDKKPAFDEDLELKIFDPLQAQESIKPNSESESDLEPPFELYGIEQPKELQPTATTQQFIVHEEESDYSDDDVPPSMQFEVQPLINNFKVVVDRDTFDLSTGIGKHAPTVQSSSSSIPPIISSWKDVGNMDEFLSRIYEYYTGKGLYCITLLVLTNLLTIAFVVILTLFLTECIDYSLIHKSKNLEQVVIPNCLVSMTWTSTLIALGIGSWWVYMMIRLVFDTIPKLIEIRGFMGDVILVNDLEMQQMLWSDLVSKIVDTHTESGGKGRLDAIIIANRIMRKENYLIAMINKDILDLSIPFGITKRQWLTRMIEDYVLYYGVFGYLFDTRGRFRKRFLKENYKQRLVRGLQSRFKQMAIISMLLSPILFVYLIIQSFFKLSEEYRQNPALLGLRGYSPLALWKMREFNELPHLFNKRMTRSHENATKYMLQFQNPFIVILARFVSFITGSFATVLLIITLFEEELQQGFEITPGKSAFFYIGVFGSILAMTQTLIKEHVAHEPQRWMNEVVLDTHYLPESWRDQAHQTKVRDEFATMFENKVVLLGYELLSVLLVPVILYTCLSASAPNIIDFIREFTVHVDSVGYICSFAVFDFEKHGNVKVGF